MKEYLLTTSAYDEPEVLSGANAYGTLLTRLLLLEPGTNPLHPDMGVGLGPNYRYMSEFDIPNLENKIQEQITTYLPSEFLTATEVYIDIKPTKFLVINIIADDTKFTYDTEGSSTPIEIADMVSSK